MYKKITDDINFYCGNSPQLLVEKYGSPLYVYNEAILRSRCREIKNMCTYKNFRVNYSAKSNSIPAILQIVHSEGLDVEAMSPGEITAELLAGFSPFQIFYISNNVSEEEMRFAIEKGVKISVDSLSQLEQYGRINAGGNVAVRINPGVGAGHHEKVVTGGKKTKFAINIENIDNALEIARKYNVKIIGINHHVGSLFMDSSTYLQAMKTALSIANKFPCLEFIDFGGGFGVPYKKQEGEPRLDIASMGKKMDEYINEFVSTYGKEIIIKVEPGRYISAECGVMLGTIHSVKTNGDIKYAGTDIGFTTLIRPALYNSHHDIEVYSKNNVTEYEAVTVVGNICETGDILAEGRSLPKISEGDIIAVLDAGAYCSVMASNYNNRLRPAEILIRENGTAVLIRRRDTVESLMSPFIFL